jgi:hypothetical protein
MHILCCIYFSKSCGSEDNERKEVNVPDVLCYDIFSHIGVHGGVVVKALRYKPADRWFDSQWCHWNFSVT